MRCHCLSLILSMKIRLSCRQRRAGKRRHLLAQMHACLVAHLPLLARHPGGEPGFVIGFLQSSRISVVQIDKIDVVERGGFGLVMEVIPDEVAHKPRPQGPVGQGQLPRSPEAILQS